MNGQRRTRCSGCCLALLVSATDGAACAGRPPRSRLRRGRHSPAIKPFYGSTVRDRPSAAAVKDRHAKPRPQTQVLCTIYIDSD